VAAAIHYVHDDAPSGICGGWDSGPNDVAGPRRLNASIVCAPGRSHGRIQARGADYQPPTPSGRRPRRSRFPCARNRFVRGPDDHTQISVVPPRVEIRGPECGARPALGRASRSSGSARYGVERGSAVGSDWRVGHSELVTHPVACIWCVVESLPAKCADWPHALGANHAFQHELDAAEVLSPPAGFTFESRGNGADEEHGRELHLRMELQGGRLWLHRGAIRNTAVTECGAPS
jgi:hypothetical protein